MYFSNAHGLYIGSTTYWNAAQILTDTRRLKSYQHSNLKGMEVNHKKKKQGALHFVYIDLQTNR